MSFNEVSDKQLTKLVTFRDNLRREIEDAKLARALQEHEYGENTGPCKQPLPSGEQNFTVQSGAGKLCPAEKKCCALELDFSNNDNCFTSFQVVYCDVLLPILCVHYLFGRCE